MVTISTPNENAVYNVIPEPRTVTVSEDGYTVTINEQDNGDVTISGLEGLSSEQAELLSGALSLWKYGLVAA
jgi:DNA-binding beta-propeller fold protein YncE